MESIILAVHILVIILKVAGDIQNERKSDE
jgi:hypothetical protein